MQRRDYGDLISAAVLIITGAAFAIYASDYAIGSLRRMGPGYFPVTIGIIIVVFGVLIALPALVRGAPMPRLEWRPLATIALAILVFGLSVERFGLVPATMLLVIIAAAARRGAHRIETLLLAAGLAALAVLLFSVGLGMPIPSFRWSF